MTTEQPTVSNVLELLMQQKDALLSVKNILEHELDAVKRRDGEALVKVAQQKDTLLKDIQARDQLISTHPNAEDVNNEAQLSALKTEITTLLEQCQTQNEVVYLAAKQSEVAIEQVKHLLIGGSKNTTYDAYGQKKSGPSLTKGIKA